MKKAYFITGTDTNVGKTLIASALLRAFVSRGFRAVGMKPVAAGCEETTGGLRCADVESLRAAGNVAAPPELVNPYALVLPVAPHIAAERAGVEIGIGTVLDAFRRLQAMSDVVVVEGVGGFMVPLNRREDTADMAQRLGVPVILVVGMRLGCLNHALLSAQVMKQRGLRLAGWVANQIEPGMPFLRENVAALEHGLQAPLLGEVPYQEGLSADEVAGLLRMALLD
ncbi:MAG: dethiobiotin synthase [Gammaproteobacteria bacterium]|nr:dethiobiotin synthase [Gammaproteobacteria bacterium]